MRSSSLRYRGGFLDVLLTGDRELAGMDFDALTPQEGLVAKQAIMNLRSLHEAAREAPQGKVLSVMETLAIQQGRDSRDQRSKVRSISNAMTSKRNGRESHLLMRLFASQSWPPGSQTAHSRWRDQALSRLFRMCSLSAKWLSAGRTSGSGGTRFAQCAAADLSGGSELVE